MQWLQDNYSLLIIIAVAVAYFILSGKKSVKSWLIYAIAIAEKDLGSGTGRLKLAQVYADFVANYPILSKIIPFAVFSSWVDAILEDLKHLLETNMDIAAFVLKIEDKKEKTE